MTLEDIKELKNKIYEIEGLLELVEMRPQKIDEIKPLIINRLRMLEWDEADGSDGTNGSDGSDGSGGTNGSDGSDGTDGTNGSDGTDRTNEADRVEGYLYSLDNEDDDIDDKSAIDFSSNNIQERELVSNTQEFIIPNSGRVINRRRPTFCLNDRFRFRKDLFGNSDTDFNSALDAVAKMSNFSEASDYFGHRYGWDSNDQNAIDFMELIKIHFEHYNI